MRKVTPDPHILLHWFKESDRERQGTTGQARRNPPGSSLHCKPAEMMMSSIVGGGAVTQSGATQCQKNHIASIGEVRVLYM